MHSFEHPWNLYSISALINVITSLSLAALLLGKTAHLKANRYFAYVCLSCAFWSFFYFMWQSSSGMVWAEFHLRTLMIGSFFIPPATFDFVHEFLNIKLHKWIRRFNYGVALCAIPFVYTHWFAYDMRPFMDTTWLTAGPIFTFTMLQLIWVMTYSLILLYQHYCQAKGLRRIQIQYVLVGVAIALFGGGYMNYPQWYGIPLRPVATILGSAYVIMVTIGILKHRLMDITIVIKKSLIYSTLISLMTLFYFFTIYIVEHWLQGLIGYQSVIASIATAVAVAMFFIPVRGWLQSIVDKYLFKASYAQMIDQNERLRREMILSERYKSFAALTKSLAYALKDPMTTIKTYAHYVPQRLEDKEFLKKMSTVLLRDVGKIDELVTRLIKYSEPPPLRTKKINIYEQIDEVVASMQPELAQHEIKMLKTYKEESIHLIAIDPDQFRQAIVQIVQHAITQMPEGGQLWISTEEDETKFTLIIKDTGKGIPKEHLEKIFDPFSRFQEDSKGMGLSIAFSIIENHNGHITVDSQQDIGTEYIVQLPKV